MRVLAKLFRDFYDRDTCTVARELVGKYLVRRLDGQLLVCRITETEAYVGAIDKAAPSYGAAPSGRRPCSPPRARRISTSSTGCTTA